MAILSDNLELALIKHLFKKAEFSIPTGMWLGLHTGDPLDGNTGSNEISGNSYARVQVVDNAHGSTTSFNSGMFSKFTFDSNDNLTNGSSIDFAEASGSWGTVSHWSLWSHATDTGSSYFLMSGSLNSGVGVASGDQFRIASGQFDITFPNRWGVGSGSPVDLVSSSNFTYSTGSSTGSITSTHYKQATEWRRQLARRLGFINEPWSVPVVGSGVYSGSPFYNWDFNSTSTSHPAVTTVGEMYEIHTRNAFLGECFLPYFGSTYTRQNLTTESTVDTVSPDDGYLYLGLYRSDPGSNVGSVDHASSGSTGEFLGNGYTRTKLVGPSTNVFGTPSTDSNGVTSIANTSAISFPEASGNWTGSVTHFGIYRGDGNASSYDIGSSGDRRRSDPILTGALTTSRSVNSGDILRFSIGDFVIKFD